MSVLQEMPPMKSSARNVRPITVTPVTVKTSDVMSGAV